MGFAAGFQVVSNAKQSKRDRNFAIQEAQADAFQKRKAEFQKTMADLKEAGENTFNNLQEAATARAKTGGPGADEQVAELRKTAQAALMTVGAQLEKNRMMAAKSRMPPEMIELMDDPAQFVESRMATFDPQVDAAKQEAQQFEVVSPEQLAQAGAKFPEGAVVQRNRQTNELKMAFDPTDNPSTLAERVALLQSSGLEPKLAEGIAAGRFVVSVDPTTSERQVIDIATGERVGGPEPIQPAGDAPPVVPPGIDTSTALGAEGFGANIINTITDVFGGGLAHPKAEEAAAAIKNIQVTTVQALQVAIPGRPAKDVREELKTLTVTPNSLLQGEQRAMTRFKQMQRFIKNDIADKEDALTGPLSPNDRAELKSNVRDLRTMETSYQDLLEGFQSKQSVNVNAAITAAMEAGDFDRAEALLDAAESGNSEALQKLLGNGKDE